MTANRIGPLRLRLAIALTGFVGLACSPESLVEVPVPSGVVEPSTVASAAGAQQLYNTAVSDFAILFAGGVNATVAGGNYIGQTAVFTDELQTSVNTGSGSRGNIDERNIAAFLPFTSDFRLYAILHHGRVLLAQARQALELYAPATPKDLRGQLLALEGYILVWFGETFCSGIPLTEVPLVGSQRLTAGFTTKEILERAVAKFDAAIALATDSTRFRDLANVGKGRALLLLGRMADAGAAVQGVSADFVYTTKYAAIGRPQQQGILRYGNVFGTNPRIGQIVDNEGTNGLAWSSDPRTVARTTSTTGPMLVSAKYAVSPSGTVDPNGSFPATPVRLADGLEARLIEAEAALAAGQSTWLTTLNTLRSTCVGTAACAPVPGLTATSLPPLSDPGTSNARIDLLMRERAMWLYLTGHRQGDLRRLGRVYGRDPETIYPTGTYLNPGFPSNGVQAAATHGSQYGKDVVFVPPPEEKTNNSLYGGCYDMQP